MSSKNRRNIKTIKTQKQNGQLVISLNPKIYPLEAIYGACYVFVDRAYLFLDGDPKKEIKVFIEGKRKLDSKKLEELAGEFKNELLDYVLRTAIAKNTKKIRETIVEKALFSAFPSEETSEEEHIESDPLGIAVPWEEKYGEKK